MHILCKENKDPTTTDGQDQDSSLPWLTGILDDISPTMRGKKLILDPKSWKRNVLKERRIAGKS